VAIFKVANTRIHPHLRVGINPHFIKKKPYNLGKKSSLWAYVKYQKVKSSGTWIIALWIVCIEDTCSELGSRFARDDINVTVNHPEDGHMSGWNMSVVTI